MRSACEETSIPFVMGYGQPTHVMPTILRRLVVTCAVLTFLGASAQAKRLAPKPVSPVISDGTRYSAEGDGRDQYVVAANSTSGSVLWKVKVFHTHIKPWMEEDVQWVYITDLKLLGNSLLIRDESSRCYALDLMTKRVKNRQCNGVF